MDNKGIEAKVVSHDGSVRVYHFAPAPGRWAMVNDYYGMLIQSGVIKTAFIKLTH